jgi:hypothetical protein
MLLNQLSSITDFDAALKQAKADLAPAEIALKKAETRCSKAESERQRLLKLQGDLNSASAANRIKIATVAQRSYLRVAIGEDLSNLFGELDKLRTYQKNITSSLAWLVSFPYEDTLREAALAEIESKRAYCVLLEAQICCARVGALRAAAGAAAHDPGVALVFNPRLDESTGAQVGGTWSSQQVENIAVLRREIEKMELDLRDNALRVSRERESVNVDNRLFT